MEQIDVGDSVIRSEDGPLLYLHLVWNHGARIEAHNARAAMEAVNEVADGRTYPLLVDMAAINFLSRRARNVFAQPCAASRIALLGESPVDQVLVDYQLHTSAVPCPTRFFTSKPDALAWLAANDEGAGTALPAAS